MIFFFKDIQLVKRTLGRRHAGRLRYTEELSPWVMQDNGRAVKETQRDTVGRWREREREREGERERERERES